MKERTIVKSIVGFLIAAAVLFAGNTEKLVKYATTEILGYPGTLIMDGESNIFCAISAGG